MFSRSLIAALASFSLISQASAKAVNIKADLKAALSQEAEVLQAGEELFEQETIRWSKHAAPSFKALVQVASEEDVQAVVKYANSNNIPFLTFGGGHGVYSGMGKVQDGIAISFSKMKGIELSEDGNIAKVQPGLHSGELIRGLFALNKRTTTGTCACTGIVGPMLGGGHGLLQGQHGLLSDQLVEARLVLADGSAVTVSDTENEDLFWGIRGAGHNFGILTGAKVKVYDQPARNWTYMSIAYPGVMAEKVFAASTELNSRMPANLNNFVIIRRIPKMNPNNSVILSNFFFDGSPEELKPHLSGYASVPQMFNMTKQGNYADIYTLGMSHEGSPQCVGNNYKVVMGVEMDEYNPKQMKKIYDVFNEFTKDKRFMGSNIVFDNYGRQGMLAQSEEGSAIHFRKYWVDVSPQIIFNDPSLIEAATEKAREIRDLFRTQDKPDNELKTYVNYAFGDEPMEAIYGREEWRLKKLRDLKKKYDPEGKFNYYAPITFEHSEVRDEL